MPDRAARLNPVAKRQLLSGRDGGRGLTLQSGHELDDLAGADVFTELYPVQFDHFVRSSRIRTGDVPEAEELVWAAFVTVRRAYPDKSTYELRPRVFTTLQNLTVNYLKSGNTQRRQASVELLGSDDRLGCPRTTPDTQLMDAQLLAIAERAVAEVAEALARKSGQGVYWLADRK